MSQALPLTQTYLSPNETNPIKQDAVVRQLLETSQGRFKYQVFVNEFGADPTGTSNSDVAIQAAINSLPASGGEVVFQPGTYNVANQLTIGNGTTSANSTIYGVVLKGLGTASGFGPNSLSIPTVPAVKLHWNGGVGGTILAVNGPLNGWGISNILFDGASVANQGINVTSGSFGRCNDLSITGCKTFGLVLTCKANSLTMHNTFLGTFINVPNVANAVGLLIDGPASGVTDSAFNHFINTSVTWDGGSTATVTGIQLKVCDSNYFDNTHFYNGTGSNIGLQFDFSANSGFPNSNVFRTLDNGQATQYSINGSPSANANNWIIGQTRNNSNVPATTAAAANVIAYLDAYTLKQSTLTSTSLDTVTGNQGARGIITDATTAATFGATIVGGGALTMPIFCDGSKWRFG